MADVLSEIGQHLPSPPSQANTRCHPEPFDKLRMTLDVVF